MNDILITSYQSPDLDGFACAYAYTEFLNKAGTMAVLGINGQPHEEAWFLLNKYSIPYQNQNLNPADFNRIILVDASELNGIDPRINPNQVVEIMDHRKINEMDKFKNAKVQIELVGSAATLIAERFIRENIEVSRSSAILLYGAIVSNTLNFQANVTTDRDRQAAEYLAKVFQPEPNFALEMFKAKSHITKENLQGRIEHDFASFDFGKKLGIGQLEMIDAESFIIELKTEVLEILNHLKQKENLDLIFLSVIDLNHNQNVFVTDDKATQELLATIFNLTFTSNIAQRAGLIMRKETTPLIKENLKRS
jgi:manganese-dependent inorganic pyrophosphatase